MTGLTLTVESLRGVVAKTITIPRGEVTALQGDNGSGKTTLATALAACLSRDHDPLGLGPQRRRFYLAEGAEEGRATLRLEDGSSIEWSLPADTMTEIGAPPRVPAMALRVGRPLLDGTQAEISERLLQALRLRPITKEELEARLASALSLQGDAKEAAGRIAEQVFADGEGGWNSAAAVAKENALSSRRRWEQTVAKAGEKQTYGARKADTWSPREGWRPELHGIALETVHRHAAEAQSAVEIAHERIVDLDREAEKVSSARKERADLEARLESARKELAAVPAGSGLSMSAATAALQEARKELAEIREPAAPDPAGADLIAAREEYRAARAAQEKADAALRDALSRAEVLAAAEKELTRAEAAPFVGDCPTCGQAIPAGHDLISHREEAIADAERGVENAKMNLPPGAVEAARHAANKAENEVDAAATRGRELAAPPPVDAEARERAEKAVGAATVAFTTAEADAQLERNRAVLRERIEGLEALPQATVGSPPTEEEREFAKVALDQARDLELRARRDAELVQIVADAGAAHRDCTSWEAVGKVLAPTGMRKERADEAAAPIRKWIDWIGAEMKAPSIELKTDSKALLRYDGRPVEAASGSERWMAETALRIAIAIACRSPVAILDGADVLSEPRRLRFRASLEVVAKQAEIAVLWTETRAGEA